jgi:hypothetical protein
MKLTVQEIARVCHEVNRAYCDAIKEDPPQVPWDEAPDWQKNSAVKGVEFKLQNLRATPEEMHNSWYAEKVRDGWKYGPVKNPDKKEHHCMVGYDSLPLEQRAKDHLFSAVVRTLSEV